MYTYASSGVYLYNLLTNDYFILSITGISNLQHLSYRFTTQELIKNEIQWIPLELERTRSFSEQQRSGSFYEFIFGLSNFDGFEFKPCGIKNLSLLTFRLPFGDPNAPLFSPNNYLPLNPIRGSEVDIPTRVSISCCPFSLTNVAMFINYNHHGTLNYKLRDGNGFLSDCRYFDDMIGGLVRLDNDKSKSIGLVAGFLKKSNGDGSLLSVVSWTTIISLLNIPDFCFSPLKSYKTLSTGSQNIVDSVVRILIETVDGEQYWGSGVVISRKYIVTNNHVIKYDELRSLQIDTPTGVRLSLQDVDVVQSPIVGYDLCFLKLRSDFSGLVPANICKTYKSQMESLQVGTKVKSVGHGLFFSQADKTKLVPLHSEGNINALIPLEIEKGRQELAMILASAACWNGSSGGGIFNTKNELIGVMTSNGKLSDGEIIPNFTLIIPITIIEKCLFMIKNKLNRVDVEQKIKDLWLLKNTRPEKNLTSLPMHRIHNIPKAFKL